MREHRIVFSADEVCSALDGRKTQVRRVMSRQPAPAGSWTYADGEMQWSKVPDIDRLAGPVPDWHREICPYGKKGSRLWVQETWAQSGTVARSDDPVKPDRPVIYRASDPRSWSWRAPVTMPRWASRLTLHIIEVWPQRLSDIGEAEAQAEGVAPDRYATEDNGHLSHPYRRGFRRTWHDVRGKTSPWDDNLWVWAIEFRTIVCDRAAAPTN